MRFPLLRSRATRVVAVAVTAAGALVSVPTAAVQAATGTGTTTVLASSSNPATVGDSVTLTATVSGSGGTPTGTVTFEDGTAAIGTGSLDANGHASFTTAGLAAGQHTLSAIYAGDATFAGSTSATLTQTMRTATSLAVLVSTGPATYGQPVTFTATLTTTDSVVPSGVVTFSDNGTAIGVGDVGAAGIGKASYTTTVLTAGNHSISAAYGGDGAHAPSSTSASATASVGAQSTSLTLTETPNPASTGQPVTLTATVAPSLLPASYSYTSDPGDYIGQGQSRQYGSETVIGLGSSTTSGLVASVNGQGDWWYLNIHAPQGEQLAVGTYTLAQRAAFASPGAPGLDVDGDGRGCNTVSGDFTVYAIDAAPNGTLRGIDVTFDQYCEGGTAALHGHLRVIGTAMPTGTVSFLDGSTPMGSATVSTYGTARFSTTALSAGSHSLGAIYSGDAGYAGSATALATPETVSVPTASVSLQSSPNPSLPGQQVTLSASVTGTGAVAPTGNVVFEDGGTALGSVALDTQGHASLSTGFAEGVHTLTAVYGGDGSYASTTSAPVSQTAQPSATMWLTSSADPSVLGTPVTLHATLAWTQGYAAPTGTVTFSEGSTVLGSPAVDGTGSASLVVGSFALGHHILTASYSGDSVYAATSAGMTQTVSAADWVDVWVSSDPSVPGQTVSFISTVATADHGAPTGMMTVLDGGTPIGSGALDSSGGFDFTTSALQSGSHDLTFQYSGDGTYPQASVASTQTVAVATPNQRFVNQLYNDVLGRPADNGASAWATALDNHTVDRTHVAMALTTSTEYISDEVQASYLAHLGREADPNGLVFWVGYIQRGGTDEDLEISFLGAPEYYTNAGGTPDAFLTALYQDVFGRAIDPGGRSYWDGRLASGTPAWQVAASVVKSNEAMSNRVTNYYWLLLGRAPDAQGLSSWTSLLQHGTRDETLLAQLAGSTEYWNDAQAY